MLSLHGSIVRQNSIDPLSRARAIADQSQAMEALQKNYLGSVLEHISSGVLTIDENGLIKRGNRAAELIFGLRSALQSIQGRVGSAASVAFNLPLEQARNINVDGTQNLLDFAAAADDAELRSAIYALDAAGFRQSGAGDWDGGSFWRQFKAWRARQAGADEGQGALTDLYAPPGRGGAG